MNYIKFFYLFVAFVCLSVKVAAQTPHETENVRDVELFFKKGKTWVRKTYNPSIPEFPPIYHKYSVGNDTIVNGHNAIRLDAVDTSSNRHYFQILAENNGKISVYLKDKKEFVPIIDFNIQLGDSVGEYLKVTNIEEVLVEDTLRRVISIGPDYSEEPKCLWIEGVGTTCDIYETMFESAIGYISVLVECSIDGKCIFTEDSLKDYSSVETPTQPDNQENITYDLSGRRVTETLPGTVYVRNGKKFVVK